MLFATDNYGFRVSAQPGEKATCPLCGESLVAKCGEVYVWHWAHSRGTDCDLWSEPETDWHRLWKSCWEPSEVEYTLCRDGVRHRADVCCHFGKVVEFQHSPISVEEIRDRERFYKDMVWVFDVREAYESGRLNLRFNGDYHTFRWKHAKKSLASVTMPVVLDVGESWVFRLEKLYIGPPCGGWGRCEQIEHLMRDLDADPTRLLATRQRTEPPSVVRSRRVYP